MQLYTKTSSHQALAGAFSVVVTSSLVDPSQYGKQWRHALITFFASIQESLSRISLRPMSVGLSLMNAIGGGVGGGAGEGAGVEEGAGGPTGGGLDSDNDRLNKARITKPIMENKTEALELKYAKLPPIAFEAWCIDAM